MAYENILDELKPEDIPLNNIYLDPNNPRFTGSDWVYTSDADVTNQSTQEAARHRLIQQFGISKLRMNMEVNGYLPIDRVVVRRLDKDSYVVLEGNRRICAAKMIGEFTPQGVEISERVRQSLETIPCLVYTGQSADASWILQGLRHITGVVDWSAFNKAKLLVEQMEEGDLSLTEVGRKFGLSPHGAGQWMRGYYAFRQARERSDYVEEVDERVYPYLQELFGRSSVKVREWAEWNENDSQFDHELNFNEFLSWFFPRDDENDENGTAEGLGNWEKRKIRRRDDLRQLAFLISDDPAAFEQFRRELDIEAAYASAIVKKQEMRLREKINLEDEVHSSIKDCARALENLPFRMLRDSEKYKSLSVALDSLSAAIEAIRNTVSE